MNNLIYYSFIENIFNFDNKTLFDSINLSISIKQSSLKRYPDISMVAYWWIFYT